MKIENSSIRMDAVHSASTVSVSGYTSEDTFTLASKSRPASASGDRYSAGEKDPYGLFPASTLIYIPSTGSTFSIEESFHDLNTRLLRHIIEMMRDMLRGNNFKTQSREEFLTSAGKGDAPEANRIWIRKQENYFSYRAEEETTTFQTKGVVRTSDGRELSFGLDLSMSRSFMEETGFDRTLDDVTLYDPLVINLDVPTAAVTDQKFFFDIDCDGTTEELSCLSRGSGFLALDKNGDGAINDGSELFGAKSGDGFRDLAAYDSDGNGWIDENDAIFGSLKIWTKDHDGTDRLLSLKEADVGAIFLGNVSSSFDLKDDETNDTLARIRSTGVFLRESTGSAGTIQHVDFSA